MDNDMVTVETQLEDLDTRSRPRPEVTYAKYLASYNWVDAYSPTMAVPGHPAVWRRPDLPQRMFRSHGSRSMNENLVRSPRYPLEPLFRAVNQVDATFDFRSVCLVADASDFRMLFEVSRGRAGRFAIKAEVVDNTMLFSREDREASI